MVQDVRYTLRQLIRRPGFTLVAVLTLAIGIGANTSIFSAARAALTTPLPFANEDRLVRVYLTPETGGPLISLRPEVFHAVQERARFFDSFVAQRYTTYALQTPDGPERIVGIAVSEGWAETLGIGPALGRTFTPEEEAAGEGSGVVLLSHGAWQRRFGGSDDILGSTLQLDGRPHTVVGVMPPGFNYPYDAELWVPLNTRDAQRGIWSFNAPALLKSGWTVEQAREDLRAVARAAAADVTELEPGRTLTAVPIRKTLVDDEGRTLVALLIAVGFLLLIVCANLANLLLARALGREREFALRAAVGASRARLLRQVLVESVVLAALGGAAGLALASIGNSLVDPLLPSSLSNFDASARLDAPVLGFTALVSIGSGILFGLVPAVRLSHGRPFEALGSAARSIGNRRGRRTERFLVMGEVALALTLLSGIGLMLRDFQRLQSADLGYEPAGLLTFSVSLNQERYPTAESRLAFMNDAARELDAIPGVAEAGATTMFPSARGAYLAQVEVAGRESAPGERILTHNRMVTPDFLETMGIPLLRGRGIAESDRAGSPPVVVVSAGLARSLWPDEDPVGQRVRNNRGGPDAPWMTVVGVVGDVKEFYEVDDAWYLPYAQHADSRSARGAVFALRSTTEQVPDGAIVRRRMAEVDPGLPVYDVIAAAELYAESFQRQGQAAILGGVFALFALFLAAIGIYGTISYSVRRRTQEIGVRMALGSDRRSVLREVAGEGGQLVLGGILLGIVGAIALSRVLAGTLSEVGGFDLPTFAAATLVLAAAGLAAALVPALRATRINPVEALRTE